MDRSTFVDASYANEILLTVVRVAEEYKLNRS